MFGGVVIPAIIGVSGTLYTRTELEYAIKKRYTPG
jgi:hypothetical protein